MRDSEALQHGVGSLPVRGLDGLVVEDPGTAEKTGENHLHAARLAGAIQHQIVRDDAEHGTQLKDIPALAPQDGHRGTFAKDRITIASDGLNERRLAAPIRAEDRDVFALFHAKAEIVERDVVTANHANVFQVYQSRSHEVHHSPGPIIISPDTFSLPESSGAFTDGIPR
jgi:hypothetical protein